MLPKIYNLVLNFLFPLSEVKLEIKNLQIKDVVNLYKPGKFMNVQYLTSYKHKIVRNLLIENKYHNYQPAAEKLGLFLEKWLAEQPNTYKIIFIPIPLHHKRKNKRGHNQVLSILQSCTNHKLNVEDKLLSRHKETETQTRLSKTRRQANLRDAFHVNNKKILQLQSYEKIVIFDDVVTTGETLLSAQSEILKTGNINPGGIITLAIAH